MKKILITLTVLMFSISAYAQRTSVIVGAGANNSSISKTENIEKSTGGDIKFLKDIHDVDNNDGWTKNINDANSNFDKSKGSLNTVIDDIIGSNTIYLITEEDPDIEPYASKNVPICTETKTRLTYENSQWHCKEPIACSEVNSEYTGWTQDPDTGKCVKPAATWGINAWGSCNAAKLQTRTVRCLVSGQTVSDSYCSAPTPLKSRDCADQ
ncbi:MAG: hypothetical protein GY793_07780 [Proteobacteria bacterium]|nr:hypothetical protein [Pseudomonadota bacterium]